MVFVMMHLQWFRQLRRFCSILQGWLSTLTHRNQSWLISVRCGLSIRQASGFKPNFASWWCEQVRSEGCPASVPVDPPQADEALALFEAFDKDVRALEKVFEQTP